MASNKGYKRAVWKLSTPALNSFENTSGGGEGPLTTDYNLGTDGRFDGILQLGPLLTAIDLAGANGASPSVTNVKRGTFSESMEATDFLAVIRGKRLATISTASRLLTSDGTATAFAADATDIYFSKSENGTEELSVGISGNNAYQVVTAIGGASYTFTANNEAIVNHVFGSNTSKDAAGQVFGFGMTAGIENTVRSNAIVGAITMDASTWAERSVMTVANLAFTGVAWWGNFIYLGTSAGPMYVNDDFQAFQLRIPEAAYSPNASNCKGMFTWSKLGVVIPMGRECRWFVGENGRSMGPERFDTNTSPVQGRITAGDANELWGMVAVYNPFLDATYLCAIRPRQGKEEYLHTNPVSYFPIAKLTDGHECEMVRWAGTKGGVTNGTWYIGDDDNVQWFIEGRNNHFPSDTTCTFSTEGSWYGTELRRAPGMEKRPRVLIFETESCTATETVTVNFTYRDRTGQSKTTSSDIVVTRNGRQVISIPEDKLFWGTRFRPEIVFARGTTTTLTPRVVGDLEVIYEEREAGNVDRMYFDYASGELRHHAV